MAYFGTPPKFIKSNESCLYILPAGDLPEIHCLPGLELQYSGGV